MLISRLPLSFCGGAVGFVQSFLCLTRLQCCGCVVIGVVTIFIGFICSNYNFLLLIILRKLLKIERPGRGSKQTFGISGDGHIHGWCLHTVENTRDLLLSWRVGHATSQKKVSPGCSRCCIIANCEE